MENKDMNTPEQDSNIVGDVPPVASSKTKKVILVGCGFCVLLFLICAGIGLPMVSKLRRTVQEFSENVKAEDDARMQRLEEQYEMPEAEESGAIDDGNTLSDDDGKTLADFMDESSDMEGSSDDEQPDEAEQPTKPVPPVVELPSITNTIGMKLNKIPAGTFTMGSPETEEGRQEGKRWTMVGGYYGEDQHKVTITKSFYMQTTEVTQGQWKAVMGTEPWKGKLLVKEGPNYAASYVSWDDAIAYCKKLSEKEGKTYRLPTEAEWEYACRAGTETAWSFGNDEKELGDCAWHKANAFNFGDAYAHQVGLKKPNAFGLYDMHGNVYEWCDDYYGMDYYKQSPEKDPTGPTSGSLRVFRGGSWRSYPRGTRSADRRWGGAADRDSSDGFRLVRALD
jgi:formylglycine-generating enzyme